MPRLETSDHSNLHSLRPLPPRSSPSPLLSLKNVEEAVESMRELVAQGKALSVNMEPVNALVKEMYVALSMLRFPTGCSSPPTPDSFPPPLSPPPPS